jgi:hypothetical protein
MNTCSKLSTTHSKLSTTHSSCIRRLSDPPPAESHAPEDGTGGSNPPLVVMKTRLVTAKNMTDANTTTKRPEVRTRSATEEEKGPMRTRRPKYAFLFFFLSFYSIFACSKGKQPPRTLKRTTMPWHMVPRHLRPCKYNFYLLFF